MICMLKITKCGERHQRGYNNRRGITCSLTGRMSIVKMSNVPKSIYECNIIPITSHAWFPCRHRKFTSKLIWKVTGGRTAKTTLKKNKVRVITLPYVKT